MEEEAHGWILVQLKIFIKQVPLFQRLKIDKVLRLPALKKLLLITNGLKKKEFWTQLNSMENVNIQIT